MKELKKLIESEEAMKLLNELVELNKCIEEKCYTIEEQEIKSKELKDGLKKVKKMMKGGEL